MGEVVSITPKFIDSLGLSKMIGVNVGTIYNWRSKGRGPKYYKVGGKVLYKEADILAWIEERGIVPYANAG